MFGWFTGLKTNFTQKPSKMILGQEARANREDLSPQNFLSGIFDIEAIEWPRYLN